MATTDLFLDFETYWGTGYSLKLAKYNTTGYIRDPQFQIHCVHVVYGEAETRIAIDHGAEDPYHQMRAHFATLPWATINMVAHNILFDGYIMRHVFGVEAATYSCTVAMARAVFQDEINNDLSSVATRLGFGAKIPDVLGSTANIRRLSKPQMAALQDYCAVDTELCKAIYEKLVEFLTNAEQELMHLTYDCFMKPSLELELERLAAERDHQAQLQADAVAATGYAASNFSSAPKYKALLEKAGVVVPLKYSEKQKDYIPALAKTDLQYIQLQATWDDRPDLRAYALARDYCASSIHTTRPQRMIDCAEEGTRKFPIAYHYFGAMNTGRWSGANKVNAQNLQRINPDDPTSGQIRKSIHAPEGHVICVQDLNAIEPRTNAYLAGQDDMLAEFMPGHFPEGKDSYTTLAEHVYGYPVDKSMKIERMVGKVGEIGLGYGMGAGTYQHTLAIGSFGPSVLVDMSLASLTVRTYRQRRHKIKEQWDALNLALEKMTEKGCAHTLGPIEFRHERAMLPSGRYLYYPGLHFSGEGEIVYWSARYKGWTKIYGGKFCENLVQGYARDVLSHHMLIINKEVARVCMHTHDELVTLATEANGQATCDAMAEVMRVAPPWAPGLPLDVSGGFAKEYSK